MKVYVIGAANLDIFAQSANEMILHDSNIAHFKMSFGGVGRNIAENFVYLFDDVEFVTRFSKDHFGTILKNDCLKKGLKLNYALETNDENSSMYIAILDHDGDMLLGLNDMAIIETLNYCDIAFLKDIIKDDDILVLDANLSPDTLNAIALNFKGYKVADAISVNKVLRLKGIIEDLDLLKCNEIEAKELLSYDFKDAKDLKYVLKRSKVPKEFVITHRYGAYVYYDQRLLTFRQKLLEEKVVNATGAGDAFIATYAYMRHAGEAIVSSVRLALAASRLTIKSTQSVVYKDKKILEAEALKIDLTEGEI